MRCQRAGLRRTHGQEHRVGTGTGGLYQLCRDIARGFADADDAGHFAAAFTQARAEGFHRALAVLVGAADHQHLAVLARQQIVGCGDALVFRRQRERQVARRRRGGGAVEGQAGHAGFGLGEHRGHLVAPQWSDHEVVAVGHRPGVGGDRAGRGAQGVVERHRRARARFGVVAGEQAVADRAGGHGQLARQRQQHRQLERRPVAIGGGRCALVEVPGLGGVERARQRQAAADQGAAGEVVQRVTGRQGRRAAGQAGVIQAGEQALDRLAVVLAGVPGQAGIGARTRGRRGQGVATGFQALRRGQLPTRLQRCGQGGRITAGQRRLHGGRLLRGQGQFGIEQGQARARGTADPACIDLGGQAACTRIVAGLVPGEGRVGQQGQAGVATGTAGQGFQPLGRFARLALVQLRQRRGVFGRGRRHAAGRAGAAGSQQQGQAGRQP